MPWAVIVVGILVQVVVWRLVARGRLPFWPAMTTTFALHRDRSAPRRRSELLP